MLVKLSLVKCYNGDRFKPLLANGVSASKIIVREEKNNNGPESTYVVTLINNVKLHPDLERCFH